MLSETSVAGQSGQLDRAEQGVNAASTEFDRVVVSVLTASRLDWSGQASTAHGAVLDTGVQLVHAVNDTVRGRNADRAATVLFLRRSYARSQHRRSHVEDSHRSVLTRYLLADLLAAGSVDWLSFDWVRSEVGRVVGLEGDERNELALRVVGEMIQQGLGIPGELNHSGFEAWNMDAGEACVRLRSLFPQYEPTGGDVAWISLTERGRLIGQVMNELPEAVDQCAPSCPDR